MKNTRTISFLVLLYMHSAIVFAQVSADTSSHSKRQNAVIKSTARIHTKGMFAYGGRICSDNPSFDINFMYERKQWGFLFFKALDLMDHTTPNNFSLALLYKTLKVNKQLTITPHFGVLLEQPHSFADHGSDVAAVLVTSFKPNPFVMFEHTALFGNLLIEPGHRDWVNRFRFLYSQKHLEFTAYVWHNNAVFDGAEYASSGVTLAYSRMPIANHLQLSVGITDVVMMASSDENSIPTGNKVMVSAALSFVK